MLFALTLLTGCGSLTNPTGIWMFTFPYDDSGSECETDMDHNFSDAEEPEEEEEEEGDWTYDTEVTGSDTFVFAEITQTTANAALLIIGGTAFPGVKEKADWVFSWTTGTTTDSEADHEEGYTFSEVTESSSTATIRLTLDGNKGTGSSSSDSLDKVTYEENDEWDDDDIGIGSTGQIPSHEYLIDEDEDPISNAADDEDCDDSDCMIEVTTTCSGSDTFTVTRTQLDEEDAYLFMATAGQ